MTSGRLAESGRDLLFALPGVAVGLAILAGLALLAVPVGFARHLERRARDRSIRDVGALPAEARPDLLVVLGCPPRTRGGRANPHLVGRAAAAARAYHALHGVTVLCSGRRLDRGADEVSAGDEAAALAELLEAAGVPSSAIRLDRDARRTIDSIEGLVDRYPDQRLLIVTQAFHLPRVLFLARAFSLDVWGLAAPGPPLRSRGRLREAFAGLRALFDVGLARRRR